MSEVGVPVEEDANSILLGFVDVRHELAGIGCCAGLLVLNRYSEPVEFVFNRSASGCDRAAFQALWLQKSATRSESRALLKSLFRACRSNPAAVVAPEERVNARLLALDLKIGVPSALLRAGSSDVLRWVPGQPSEDVKSVVRELTEVASLAEPIERVEKGLMEAYAPKPT